MEVMNTFRQSIHSPLGILEITTTDTAVQAVDFVEDVQAATGTNTVLTDCIQQLEEYFQGKRKNFDLPLQQQGTDFQQKVWHLLTQIPYGSTTSYLALARQVGNEKSIRAVGTTNGKNNIAIIVPCHRVIGSDGKLVGYAGGLWRKQWLLEHEAKIAHGAQTLF